MNFLHHLANLPADSLAGEIFLVQEEREIGIVKELKEHLQKMGNVNPKDVSKTVWKKKTKQYIEEKNRKDILQDIRNYKKLNHDELSAEKFERKKYFSEMNLENARVMFKVKSQVLPTIRKNFPQKYRKESLLCPSCRDLNISIPEEDTQFHVATVCPAFSEFRHEKDLVNNDHDLIEFYKKVIDYRINNNQE